ncbi:MAG: twin-arginine translocase subunit TatC [Bacteriovoracaceae bacterium]|nr:twin-arginine translocase subunit TatC [Bacteriovoracaceae bacterium]
MKEMSLVEHLTELRVRAIRVLVILIIGFFLCYNFGEIIAEFLMLPLREALGSTGKVVYLGLLDKVLAQMQVAFWSAILLTSPFWFREVWLFIRPGLHDREAKIILPFLAAGFFLFWGGVAFGYYLVFPYTFEAIMSFGSSNVEAALDYREYLILASKVLVCLGFVFQLPNVMLILGFMDLVTKQSLRELRRYIYVIFSVFAAIITPPDVITMMALWIPLVLLYEVGIIAVALIVHPYLKRKYPLVVTDER